MKLFRKFTKLKKWQKVLAIVGGIILVSYIVPNPFAIGRILGLLLAPVLLFIVIPMGLRKLWNRRK